MHRCIMYFLIRENRMKKTTSLKLCVVASCLLLSPMISADALTKSGVKKLVNRKFLTQLTTTPTGISTLAFMASLFYFFSRDPNNQPDRYTLSVDAFKANPLGNAYYFVLDGIIGNAKKSATIKADKDGNIEVKIGAPARGFYGKVSETIKPLLQTLGFLGDCAKLTETCALGLLAWGVTEEIIENA